MGLRPNRWAALSLVGRPGRLFPENTAGGGGRVTSEGGKSRVISHRGAVQRAARPGFALAGRGHGRSIHLCPAAVGSGLVNQSRTRPSRTTAWAAMASPRPMASHFSLVPALMLTWAAGPRAVFRRATISALKGLSLGFSARTV